MLLPKILRKWFRDRKSLYKDCSQQSQGQRVTAILATSVLAAQKASVFRGEKKTNTHLYCLHTPCFIGISDLNVWVTSPYAASSLFGGSQPGDGSPWISEMCFNFGRHSEMSESFLVPEYLVQFGIKNDTVTRKHLLVLLSDEFCVLEQRSWTWSYPLL